MHVFELRSRKDAVWVDSKGPGLQVSRLRIIVLIAIHLHLQKRELEVRPANGHEDFFHL